MVLERLRDRFESRLRPIAWRLRHVDPNTISWLAMFMAAVAGVLIALAPRFPSAEPFMLFGAGASVALSGILDVLDGRIARIAKRTTRRGDFLDHVLDRYADFVILAGILISGYAGPFVTFFALSGILLTSYLGTQAQAIGAKRDYRGLLGRADRLAMLIAAPAAQLISIGLGYPTLPWFFGLTWFGLMMWWFAIAGHLTALQRGISVWRTVKD